MHLLANKLFKIKEKKSYILLVAYKIRKKKKKKKLLLAYGAFVVKTGGR